MSKQLSKQQWRARMLARRRDRPEAERSAAREATARHLLAELGAPPGASAQQAPPAGAPPAAPLTVCAFLPLPSEPLAADLPARLAAAGPRVLVPIARPNVPLDWCDLLSETGPGHDTGAGPGTSVARGTGDAETAAVTGPLGIAEPTGPRLGPEAIRWAEVVLLPALAVDGHGIRLGRGGGHYDRSLALLAGRPAPRLIAVVYDDEVVDALPRDPHDLPVTEVLTPAGGLRHVARGARPGASSN